MGTSAKDKLLKKGKKEAEAAAKAEDATAQWTDRRKWEGKKLEEYAEGHFNFDRKGMFKGKSTVEKMLAWKKDVISTSLCRINEDLNSDACQAFKNITGYMGDRSSKKDNDKHAHKLIKIVLAQVGEVRDEVFCQLCKQTTQNPDPESTLRGWKLFVICIGTFPPTPEFFPYLMSYLEEHQDHEEYGPYAKKCMEHVPTIMELGQRHECPTSNELVRVANLEDVPITIKFLDGSSIEILIDSWTTSAIFDDQIAKHLNIQDVRPFATFEVNDQEEERLLERNERLLDVVSTWAKLEDEARASQGKNYKCDKFDFMYKVRQYYEVDEEDTEAIRMLFIQAVSDVLDNRYNDREEKDQITLAALQAQESVGDFEAQNETFAPEELVKYLPKRYLNKGRDEELEEKITKVYQQLAGYSALEARLSYLDLVKGWNVYGSTYFFMEKTKSCPEEWSEDVVLAANAKGVMVLQDEPMEVLAEHKYDGIVTWGHSSNTFVLVASTRLTLACASSGVFLRRVWRLCVCCGIRDNCASGVRARGC